MKLNSKQLNLKACILICSPIFKRMMSKTCIINNSFFEMSKSSYLISLLLAFFIVSSSTQSSSSISQGFLPLAGNKIDKVVIGYGDDGILLTESKRENLDIDIERVNLDVNDETEWTVEWEIEGDSFHLVNNNGDVSIVGPKIQLEIGALISSIAKVPIESVGDLIGSFSKNAINAAYSAASISSFSAADVIGNASDIVKQNINQVNNERPNGN